MTERELISLHFINWEIEQYQTQLQGPNLDPAACLQSVRHIVAEHRAWVEEVLERRVAERDRLEGYIAAIDDEQTRLIFAYHFAAGMSGAAVAARLGGGLTAEECSRIVDSYLEREHKAKHRSEKMRLKFRLDDVPDGFMREVLTLRYSEGLPWKDVAERIGGGNTSAGLRIAASRYLKKRESA